MGGAAMQRRPVPEAGRSYWRPVAAQRYVRKSRGEPLLLQTSERPSQSAW